jgi:hypothetical protein
LAASLVADVVQALVLGRTIDLTCAVLEPEVCGGNYRNGKAQKHQSLGTKHRR